MATDEGKPIRKFPHVRMLAEAEAQMTAAKRMTAVWDEIVMREIEAMSNFRIDRDVLRQRLENRASAFCQNLYNFLAAPVSGSAPILQAESRLDQLANDLVSDLRPERWQDIRAMIKRAFEDVLAGSAEGERGHFAEYGSAEQQLDQLANDLVGDPRPTNWQDIRAMIQATFDSLNSQLGERGQEGAKPYAFAQYVPCGADMGEGRRCSVQKDHGGSRIYINPVVNLRGKVSAGVEGGAAAPAPTKCTQCPHSKHSGPCAECLCTYFPEIHTEPSVQPSTGAREWLRAKWPHRPMTSGGLPDEALNKWQEPTRKEIEKWLEAYADERLAQARSATIEECAKSVCRGCREGHPFHQDFPSQHVTNGQGIWSCASAAIRSLAAEEKG